MAHKHADLMMQYALDAAETDKPWKRWEVRDYSGNWTDLVSGPSWSVNLEYRRKPSQEQIDKEAFNRWWTDSFDEGRYTIFDAWFAALEWERNRP